jgi:predicted methyltransferase
VVVQVLKPRKMQQKDQEKSSCMSLVSQQVSIQEYILRMQKGESRERPDYLATIDVDPSSKTYSQVIHRVALISIRSELTCRLTCLM